MQKKSACRKVAGVLIIGAMAASQAIALPSIASATPTIIGEPPYVTPFEPTTDELNRYIWGMNYNKLNLLTHHGETLDNFYPSSAHDNHGEFVVVEHTKKTLKTSSTSQPVTAMNEDRVYPGALFKADQNLLNNTPSLISIPRGPMTVSVDLPGMRNGESQGTMIPSNSSVRSAINTLLARWTQQYQGSYSVPAQMQYDSVGAQSMHQLSAKFGIDFAKLGAPLKIDFDAIHRGEKQTEVVNFRQTYYNVSVDAPTSPAEFFAPGTTVQDLVNRGITEKQPPVYVSNVAYGRAMYVKFETTNKSNNFHAAIDAVIKGVPISPNGSFQNTLDHTSMTAVILGGNPDGAARVVTGNIDTLKELIREGGQFTPQSPAVPIAYTTSFVKDNAVATIQNNTDYIDTTVSAYRNGYLTLDHRGAYIARYYIYWDEYGVDINGYPYIRSREWEGNGKKRTAHFNTTIEFKGNVRNLRIKVEEKTGLVWEPWRTIYNKTELPLVQHRTISNWGTTLWPKFAEKVENN